MIYSDAKNKLVLFLIILFVMIGIYPACYIWKMNYSSQNDSLSCVTFDLDEIKKKNRVLLTKLRS